jgi:uncharacterized membrane-anchored protein
MLAEEVHARPPMSIAGPCQVSYVAVMVDSESRQKELEHINSLCIHFGVSGPALNATHHLATLAGNEFKWERHGEFSSYTFVTPLDGTPSIGFDSQALNVLPERWLARIPGQTIAAVQASVRLSVLGEFEHLHQQACLTFDTQGLVGSHILENRATVLTDFRLKQDGFTRIVLLDHGLTTRQIGQTLQRLFEIEAYRMLALLSLPIARRQSPRIVEIEKSLGELTDNIAREGADDETLLNQLTHMAAEIESGIAASQFRFGASRAYYTLVNNRIQDCDEQSITSIPTIGQFMRRRFDPAIATCNTVSQRLHDVSERVAQASGLLSTRVEIAREQQNHHLLSSMDKRAKMQLRLQQTVEGLSVAAIVYYLAGLVAYLAKALKTTGLPFNPDWIVALSIPLLAIGVYFGMRRARREFADDVNQSGDKL